MKLISRFIISGLQSIWVVFLLSAFTAGLAGTAYAQLYPEGKGGFNGLSINYSVTGADLGTPTDVGDFTTYRDYKSGRLAGSRVNITGTANNEWGATVSLSVFITDNRSGRKDSFSFTMAGTTTSKDFSVGLDIYQDTTDVSFRITESASYGNGESRGLWVGGSLTKGSTLTAEFSATPLSGNSPLIVEFSDMSTGGTVTSWRWEILGTDFISTAKNFKVKFTNPGPDVWKVSVQLTVSTGGLTATKTKNDYIVVFPAQPILDDKTKADIIINYGEDLDLGEPIFVPKRQETYYV